MSCFTCDDGDRVDVVRSSTASRLAECRDEEARLALEAMQAAAEVEELAFPSVAELIRCDDSERRKRFAFSSVVSFVLTSFSGQGPTGPH